MGGVPGGIKVPIKFHVLFEWPLKTILLNCLRKTTYGSSINDVTVLGERVNDFVTTAVRR